MPEAARIRLAVAPRDAAAVARLWAQLGWGRADAAGQALAARALAGAAWAAVAELEGRFAGYARALSDGVLVTYLAEVAVVPDWRRRGLGGALIRACRDRVPHTAIYADAAPDILGLNIRHGLRPRPAHLTACARGALAGGEG